MKNKTIYVILTVLFMLLFTSAHDAWAADKSPFKTYIQKPFYETKLKNAASTYVMARSGQCDVRNTTFARKRYDILQQPVFRTKRLHPFEGIWIEKVTVFVCGNAHALDITVISDKEGRLPKFDVSPSRP